MKRTFKYKLNPTVKQQHLLLQHMGCARFIYNWGLDLKIKVYQQHKTSLSYVDIAKQLTTLKHTPEHIWLNDVATESLQQSLRCMDNAFKNFFREKKGFPKFKSKHSSKDTCKFINNIHFDFTDWKVKIPKVGWVKLCQNKAFNPDKYKQGTLTVIRDKCGTFWCTIATDNDKPLPPKTKVTEDTAVGIDLGIKDFAILSNGIKYPNPKYYEHTTRCLRRAMQSLSRKAKGSKKWYKAKTKVAILHRYVADCRSDYLHKLTTYLVLSYDTICLEDLNVKGMMQNHHLAQAIASASWSEFRRMLVYKCDWHGKNLLFIDRFEPSSKTCNCCGCYVNKELRLSDRVWTCPQCGAELDRDVNAAKNIKSMALSAIRH